MSTTIALSPAFLLKSVHSFMVRPLHLHTTVHTLFLFPIWYAKWLILIPSLSLGGFCSHTTSAFCSTHGLSTAMVHTYDLAWLCWITLSIGDSSSHCIFRFNVVRRSRRSYCCGWCCHCHCCYCHARSHCDIICLQHQQKTFPSGRNGSVRVDAHCQSRQRHPGGGLLCARRQYHASHCISPSDRCFAISSRSVGRLFQTNTLALWPTVTIRRNGFIGYTLASGSQCNG